MKLQLHLADALEMMDQIKKLPKQYYLGDGVCPAFLDAQIAATFVQRRSGVACTWSWGGGSSVSITIWHVARNSESVTGHNC